MAAAGYRDAMTVALVAVGLLLIAAALLDLFHTLYHPRGFGTLARLCFRAVWGLHKPLRRRGSGELAGPLGLVLTVGLWATMLVLGFALVYLPFMPGDFNYGSSLDRADSSGVVAAVYLSLVAVATLGLGDILPASDALRIVVPLQALAGFVLLTGAISWVLQLYPALTRRRTLARRLHGLAEADVASGLPGFDPSVVVTLLEEVRGGLATVEIDLFQYGESYYFRERQADISLAAVLPSVPRLVAGARANEAAESRAAADLLEHGLDRLLLLLGRDFVDVKRDGDREQVLAAFAADHGQEPV